MEAKQKEAYIIVAALIFLVMFSFGVGLYFGSQQPQGEVEYVEYIDEYITTRTSGFVMLCTHAGDLGCDTMADLTKHGWAEVPVPPTFEYTNICGCYVTWVGNQTALTLEEFCKNQTEVS